MTSLRSDVLWNVQARQGQDGFTVGKEHVVKGIYVQIRLSSLPHQLEC